MNKHHELYASYDKEHCWQYDIRKKRLVSDMKESDITENQMLKMRTNNFTFEFYKKLIEDNDENIFFSPYSIFTALSMAYEGAQGNTATEMYDIFEYFIK